MMLTSLYRKPNNIVLSMLFNYVGEGIMNLCLFQVSKFHNVKYLVVSVGGSVVFLQHS